MDFEKYGWNFKDMGAQMPHRDLPGLSYSFLGFPWTPRGVPRGVPGDPPGWIVERGRGEAEPQIPPYVFQRFVDRVMDIGVRKSCEIMRSRMQKRYIVL